MKTHNKVLDVAKGIAIMLVVLGHSFPDNVFTGQTRLDQIATFIYDFVYSFHMPVFFCISGYLFYDAWISHSSGTIKRKAQRLLIPYITLAYCIYHLDLLHLVWQIHILRVDIGELYWESVLMVECGFYTHYLYFF